MNAGIGAWGDQRTVGVLLREWRTRRRLSQLDLAVQADISTRHLSFVETGRSRPTSEMILRLAGELDVPLRERNRLLLAGGFAPVYSENELDAPQMQAVRTALRHLLAAHQPFPAVVIDRGWNMVDANASVALFTQGATDELLAPPCNVLRLSLHPEGMAPRITNLGEWRSHLLSRLRRQATLTADPALIELYEELRGYPCRQEKREIERPGPGDVLVPLQYRHNGRELTFFSTTAVFGTPLDITLAELAIESFYPANPTTDAALRSLTQ
ncbi:MAG: helix-turn-helix domain-containing protein [Pseudonocardiaceae bacterium]